MKIAITTDSFWPRINGVTVSTDIFWSELKDLGHDAQIWASDYPGTSPTEGVHRLPSHSLWFSSEDRLVRSSQRKRFEAELDAFGPDLIHIQTEFGMARFALKYARTRHVPVVMTCHTYFEPYIQYYFPFLRGPLVHYLAKHITAYLFQNADHIITPTAPMKAILQSYGIGCPISVLPTGIRPQDFGGLNRDQLRPSAPVFDQHPLLRGKRLLLSVGRVGREKNLDFLLQVMEKLVRIVPDAALMVAGRGPYLDGFQQKITQMHLDEHVVCLGNVSREELNGLYTLAEVFTFASVTETQGLVTIEAMMCRTPVVAIGKMGTREVMAGDNGGFMVDEDVEEFTSRVEQLLTDRDLHRRKSEEAWAYSQNWTSRAMAERLVALYRELVRHA